ncbi:MAG: AAA family ATPase [Propionibacteriaceae bacterium]|nr:AAA family ATPase [Propionibacteriaceae bacterium]
MATVDAQIRSVDLAICANITLLSGNRALLSQNLLAQLRNFIEAVVVRIFAGSGTVEFTYQNVGPALKFVRSRARLNFLGRFHKLVQASASHYTLDGDASERLMLKYYEYLHRTRDLMQSEYGIAVLDELDKFPTDSDLSLQFYHEKIAEEIRKPDSLEVEGSRSRYYIRRIRPFYVRGKVYYEVTFQSAVDRASKFERMIAFTDLDITTRYAANLNLVNRAIEAIGQAMPILIIRQWEVSIRPCELNNFGRIFDLASSAQSGSSEYRSLMHYLTQTGSSLVDIVDLEDQDYADLRDSCTERVRRAQIFPTLDSARGLLRRKLPGSNVVRYLLLHMDNRIIKQQFNLSKCSLLSGLRLWVGCKPFDEMPFCTSLPDHNPRLTDLLECLRVEGREHELLARRVKTNLDRRGMLYTPIDELSGFDDINRLISRHNQHLYRNHGARRLVRDMGHVFVVGHEEDTAEIIRRLQSYSKEGIRGYHESAARWLESGPVIMDDPVKADALRRMFSESRVALIYGAAGTGKTTMVNYIASYFGDYQKLFLAQTNPAVDNLRRRVSGQNATFRTIASQIRRRTSDIVYDLLVIDECSTVSNADLIKVLRATRFKLIVLVGDVHQIEAIHFGNWFSSARSFVPASAAFELTTPFRTRSAGLLLLWDKVRRIDSDIAEWMARGGYSSVLDESLFVRTHEDEIILCLNYDGLYGINNVNRLLQSANPAAGTEWGNVLYKVGDPVLFNEVPRFKPLIFNNLKGRVAGVSRSTDQIWFDVELDRGVSALDVEGLDLVWLGGSTVRFSVRDHGNGDDDSDDPSMAVPFQIAYAVSIHRAQGLEFQSVKVVITRDGEDDVSHNVLYTAITRAREHLKVYWTPETQHRILSTLEHRTNHKDVHILANRCHLTVSSG